MARKKKKKKVEIELDEASAAVVKKVAETENLSMDEAVLAVVRHRLLDTTVHRRRRRDGDTSRSSAD